MTGLEKAIGIINGIFDQYADCDGDKSKLSRAEMKTLLEKELPQLLQGPDKNANMDKIMKVLDSNEDKELDFDEFMMLVAAIAKISRAKK